MANPEHVKILKQGATEWNKWRKENPKIKPDLRRAVLAGLNLAGAIFVNADLYGVDLKNADLRRTIFFKSFLNAADFSHADLTAASLARSRLRETILRAANLTHSELVGTEFIEAALDEADLTRAMLGHTIIVNTDLSTVVGLQTVRHEGPSNIGIDTFFRSHGKIPEAFLRGCGVPEDFITYARSLVTNPIEYYSCFISYSSKDKQFADRLHADLQAKNIRCWYALEDLIIGDKFRTRIEESIRIYDKVMIVFSENSIQSAWVEDEVEAGLERERKNPGSLILLPIRLDAAIMETKQAWAASLRRTRHIGDFSNWKNHGAYQKSFERLLRDLKSQTKAAPPSK